MSEERFIPKMVCSDPAGQLVADAINRIFELTWTEEVEKEVDNAISLKMMDMLLNNYVDTKEK